MRIVISCQIGMRRERMRMSGGRGVGHGRECTRKGGVLHDVALGKEHEYE
jgi:hypothetical protein